MAINNISFSGNLGSDAVQRTTAKGTDVVSFSVASSVFENGESKTTWVRVSYFGATAVKLLQYLVKGKQVYVQGRFKLNEFKNKDGNMQQSLEVTATDVQLLGGREDAKPKAEAETFDFEPVEDTDNVPF
jgi:single-strand DNA-binding protein